MFFLVECNGDGDRNFQPLCKGTRRAGNTDSSWTVYHYAMWPHTFVFIIFSTFHFNLYPLRQVFQFEVRVKDNDLVNHLLAWTFLRSQGKRVVPTVGQKKIPATHLASPRLSSLLNEASSVLPSSEIENILPTLFCCFALF